MQLDDPHGLEEGQEPVLVQTAETKFFCIKKTRIKKSKKNKTINNFLCFKGFFNFIIKKE